MDVLPQQHHLRRRANHKPTRQRAEDKKAGHLLHAVQALQHQAGNETGDGLSDGLPGISLNTYVVWRCNRWGVYVRWLERVSGPSPGPRYVESWWRLILDGNVQHSGLRGKDNCPVDMAEAVETGKCIRALPEHLMDAMIEEHLIGGRQADKAKALDIDPKTFWSRCQNAYERLLGLMNDIAAGIPLEQQTQRLGRPAKERTA